MNIRRKDNLRKRELMSHIFEKHDLPESLSEEDMYILKRCNDAGYIEGLRVTTMASGRIVLDAQTLNITDKGREFLSPKKDYKFIISTTIAVIELVVIIIQAVTC